MRVPGPAIATAVVTLALWAGPYALGGGGPLPLSGLDEKAWQRLASEGIRVEGAQLEQLARAVVRIEGPAPAAGVLVSQDGLVLTSYGAVGPCLDALGEKGATARESGFAAWKREDEPRCPGVSAVLDGDAKGGPPAGPVRFDDVRLVVAPERALARFGGAREARHWPRQRADWAFVRIHRGSARGAASEPPSARFATHRPPAPGSLAMFRGAAAFSLERAAGEESAVRISWGAVDGFERADGTGRSPWTTPMASMYARTGDLPAYRLPEQSVAQLAGVRTPAFVDRLLQDVPVAFVLRDAPGADEIAGAPVFDGAGRLVGIGAGSIAGPGAPKQGPALVVTDLRFILDLLIRRYGAVEVAAELGL